MLSCGITDLLSNSPKRSPQFSPGYEGTENMFYFLNILKLYFSMPIRMQKFLTVVVKPVNTAHALFQDFNYIKKKFNINHPIGSQQFM